MTMNNRVTRRETMGVGEDKEAEERKNKKSIRVFKGKGQDNDEQGGSVGYL